MRARRMQLVAATLCGALGMLTLISTGAMAQPKAHAGSSCGNPNMTRWSTNGMDPTTDTRDARIGRSYSLDKGKQAISILYKWQTKRPGVVICRATLEYWAPNTTRAVTSLTVHLKTGRVSGSYFVHYGRTDPRRTEGSPNLILLTRLH